MVRTIHAVRGPRTRQAWQQSQRQRIYKRLNTHGIIASYYDCINMHAYSYMCMYEHTYIHVRTHIRAWRTWPLVLCSLPMTLAMAVARSCNQAFMVIINIRGNAKVLATKLTKPHINIRGNTKVLATKLSTPHISIRGNARAKKTKMEGKNSKLGCGM